MLESKFQANLIEELKETYPGCFIMKQDEQYTQGIPDLIILYRTKWAMLECKASFHSPYRPNQEYYLDMFDSMSFAAMICPENKEEILRALYQTFRPRRNARIS